jgi:hypothetical protein
MLAMKVMDKGRFSFDYKHTFQNEKVYDYLRDIRDNPEMKDDALYQELAQEILVTKYTGTILDASNAFDKMEKESGMEKKQVVAFFTDRRLENWDKSVTRYLAEKKRLGKVTQK